MKCFSTFRFKNVMFDISPTEEVGDFEVKAKFMGVEMEKVQLHFQVKISQVCQNFTKQKSLTSHHLNLITDKVKFPVPIIGLVYGIIMEIKQFAIKT